MKRFNTIDIFLFLINIIIGTGVFLNTVPVFNLLGSMSWLAYLVTGLAMIPIIYATYSLAFIYPGYNMVNLLEVCFGERASFYALLYTCGKIGTAAIGFLFMNKILSGWCQYEFFITFIFLFFMIVFLLVIGLHINTFFMFIILFLKLSIVVAAMIYCFGYLNVEDANLFLTQSNTFNITHLGQAVSITIFAFAGFESLFAVTHLLKDKRYGAYILASAFFVALFLYGVYQYTVSKILLIAGISFYQGGFMELLHDFAAQGIFFSLYIFRYIEFALFMACFGATYSILYANINNMHSILSKMWQKINIKTARFIILILVFLYSIAGSYNVLFLQQFSTLATIVLYALFLWQYYKKTGQKILSLVGGISLIGFIGMHIYNAIFLLGFWGYVMYGVVMILVFALCQYGRKRKVLYE